MEKQSQHQSQLRLFPNYFKKVGIGLFLFALIALKLVNIYLMELNPLWFERYHDFLPILRFDISIIGLLLFAFAKDKIEDELTILIRLQSIEYAFTFTVLFVIITHVVNFTNHIKVLEVDGSFITTLMLVAYIFNFYIKKKNR